MYTVKVITEDNHNGRLRNTAQVQWYLEGGEAFKDFKQGLIRSHEESGLTPANYDNLKLIVEIDGQDGSSCHTIYLYTGDRIFVTDKYNNTVYHAYFKH